MRITRIEVRGSGAGDGVSPLYPVGDLRELNLQHIRWKISNMPHQHVPRHRQLCFLSQEIQMRLHDPGPSGDRQDAWLPHSNSMVVIGHRIATFSNSMRRGLWQYYRND